MIKIVKAFLLFGIFFTSSGIILFSASESSDYCKIKKCAPMRHTLCLYYSDKPSPKCGRVSSVGLSYDEIKDIVKLHNKYRSFVAYGHEKRGNPGPQYPAKNMPELKWLDELAIIAQRWANQCNFEHDECRHVARFSVGQNLAQLWDSNSSLLTVKSLVQSWYDEVDDFDRNDVHSFQFDSLTGHYTQMVWADTKTIGCGMVRYTNKGLHSAYLVCNYGPRGNYLDEPVYEIKVKTKI